jgi:hypothetical protein
MRAIAGGAMLAADAHEVTVTPHSRLFSMQICSGWSGNYWQGDRWQGGENLGARICLETFLHAITCAVAGSEVASTKQNRALFRPILAEARVEQTALRSIDAADAALIVAYCEPQRSFNSSAYGNTRTDSGKDETSAGPSRCSDFKKAQAAVEQI